MMDNQGGRGDARFNLAYNMNLLSGETPPDIYSSPMGRVPSSTSLQQMSPGARHSMVTSVCGGQSVTSRVVSSGLKGTDGCYDDRNLSSQNLGMETCGVSEIEQDTYTSMQPKKSPPSNGKKTKGRVKIKMEYIENKLRRYTTFSKRKTGIMKKAYELSTLTGTQVMLLVASETGHVYTFATRKLQPMITSEAGKALIQTCLNSPDPAGTPGPSGADQRMSATGFEETELTYNISDDDTKDDDMSPFGESSDSGSGAESPPLPSAAPPASNTEHESPAPALDIHDAKTNGTSSNSQNHTSGNKTTNTVGDEPISGAFPPGLAVYQTAEGTMYAAPSSTAGTGGVPTGAGFILSLQSSTPGAPPQLITIPLLGPPSLIPKSSPTSSTNSNASTSNSVKNEQLDLSIKNEIKNEKN